MASAEGPAATGSAAPAGATCSFCPWPAVNVIRSARPTLPQLALRRKPRSCYVCAKHIVRGLQYVRKGY